MTVTDYLLHVFYLIDTEIKALNLPRLRQRGPQPALADSEVITMELAGEFLGVDTDKGIWEFFRRYHRAEFPRLADVDRTTFARQAAALWRVKQLLHGRVLAPLPLADPVDGQRWWVIDSFPIRTCRLARAPRGKLFRGLANYGHDPTTPRDLYFGLRVHLRVSDRGPAAQLELTGANVADLDAACALAPADPREPCLGDRNYWYRSAHRFWQLARASMVLLAPYKKKSLDPDPRRSRLLTRLRQIIETVIGQLATRFHAERTWARDLWHLTSRLGRKVLSHTVAVLLNWRAGNPPLQLDRLIDA
jgi:Transposase DDE domain